MNYLVLVLSSQLLYYLLVTQTGVVGAFDSHIHDLYTLPIGGVIGTLFSAFWRHNDYKMELTFLFGVQIMISWFYPNYSLGMLLALGFVVGYTTPILLTIFSSQGKIHLAWGLAISYAVGTALYSYPFVERGGIALILPMISLIALRLFNMNRLISIEYKKFPWRSMMVMMLWIFADSALFETLSRSVIMDIWSEYTLLIIFFHLLGVYTAYHFGDELLRQIPMVLGLFIVSYLLYWLEMALVLAMVYPFVISYYNVLLFHKLMQIRNIRVTALSMIGIGWVATSSANAIALGDQLWIAAGVLGIFSLLYPFYFRRVL
jgi:beta-carotene 15,15'-dioxygenase